MMTARTCGVEGIKYTYMFQFTKNSRATLSHQLPSIHFLAKLPTLELHLHIGERHEKSTLRY
eukprot:COSAG01_NODE_2911_length_6875_cov_93.023318_7_plen_62_part_00